MNPPPQMRLAAFDVLADAEREHIWSFLHHPETDTSLPAPAGKDALVERLAAWVEANTTATWNEWKAKKCPGTWAKFLADKMRAHEAAAGVGGLPAAAPDPELIVTHDDACDRIYDIVHDDGLSATDALDAIRACLGETPEPGPSPSPTPQDDEWTDEEHWRAMSQEGRSEILYQTAKHARAGATPAEPARVDPVPLLLLDWLAGHVGTVLTSETLAAARAVLGVPGDPLPGEPGMSGQCSKRGCLGDTWAYYDGAGLCRDHAPRPKGDPPKAPGLPVVQPQTTSTPGALDEAKGGSPVDSPDNRIADGDGSSPLSTEVRSVLQAIADIDNEDAQACCVCAELLDRPENDNGDGEWLGHTSDCPVPRALELLEGDPDHA